MKTVKGKYDGRKVVLDEDVKIDHEVPVIVTFIEDKKALETTAEKKWRWEESRKLADGFKGSVVKYLIEERRSQD